MKFVQRILLFLCPLKVARLSYWNGSFCFFPASSSMVDSGYIQMFTSRRCFFFTIIGLSVINFGFSRGLSFAHFYISYYPWPFTCSLVSYSSRHRLIPSSGLSLVHFSFSSLSLTSRIQFPSYHFITYYVTYKNNNHSQLYFLL